MNQDFTEFDELDEIEEPQPLNVDHEKEYGDAKAILAKTLRLSENEDYKWLVAIMQNNLDARVSNVFQAVTGVDSAITNLVASAEIRGFQAAMQFINSMRNGAEAAVRIHEPYVKKGNE